MEKSLEILENTKLSYLRNAGNILEISKELNMPIEQVKTLVEEFRKKEDTEVAELIANNLMRQILVGSASRKLILMEMLKSLESEDKSILSICCDAPVRVNKLNKDNTKNYECLKCFEKNCETISVPETEIYQIKLTILEGLRDEDGMLVELAEKMGYTKKVGPSTVVNQKNNYLILSSKGKDNSQLSEKEQYLIEDCQKLSPMDRERLIEKLQREITTLNGKLEETNKADNQLSTDLR